MKKFSLKNVKTRHFLYALLAAGLLVSCSKGDGEFGKQLAAFLESPISEMSVLDLVLILFIVGLITK